jgi:hypothetical protein
MMPLADLVQKIVDADMARLRNVQARASAWAA